MEEAGISAAISAGAEVLTEKFSDGIKLLGGKTVTEAVKKQLAQAISDKTVRTLMKLGLDTAGEGLEEVAAEVINAVGQKLTYASEKEMKELLTKESLWDAFIGGAVMGNISGTTKAVAGKNLTGWDGREVVKEATGPSVTVDGKKYQLLGYDAKGVPVYEDARKVQEQEEAAKADGKNTKNNTLATPGELGEKAIPYSERGIELEPRAKAYLNDLKADRDYIERAAGEIQKQDLAVLTAETGVEYTLLTVGNKEYLIRGQELSTTIPQELADAMLREKGMIACHSHPFIGDLSPSKSDLEFIKRLTWQKDSVIVDPTQRAVRFTADGSVEVFDLINTRDGDYYNKLFGGGDD